VRSIELDEALFPPRVTLYNHQQKSSNVTRPSNVTNLYITAYFKVDQKRFRGHHVVTT
jgi:hypothetical protein